MPGPSTSWSLHPQLARDGVALGDLPLSHVLVMNDANYPWLVLVPRRPDLVEIIDLGEPDRLELMAEICNAARALKRTTGCDKLNIATARACHRALSQRCSRAAAGVGASLRPALHDGRARAADEQTARRDRIRMRKESPPVCERCGARPTARG